MWPVLCSTTKDKREKQEGNKKKKGKGTEEGKSKARNSKAGVSKERASKRAVRGGSNVMLRTPGSPGVQVMKKVNRGRQSFEKRV